MALTDQLTAIGNAIRAKTGGSALIPLNDMPSEIASIPSGSLPAEALTITGNCNNRFAYDGWNWFITYYGNQVTTSNISTAQDMFSNTTINSIPFSINFGSSGNAKYLFRNYKGISTPVVNLSSTSDATALISMYSFCTASTIGNVTLPNNYVPSNLQNVIQENQYLTEIPTWIVNLNHSTVNNATSDYLYRFYNMRRLRNIPVLLMQKHYNRATGINCLYRNLFYNCSLLDEIKDLYPLPVNPGTNNNSMFSFCNHLKAFAFLKDNNQPFVREWKNVTLNLADCGVGMGTQYGVGTFMSPTSGSIVYTDLGADKQVTDTTSYNLLKNDPDWWTADIAYSRYNHDSAVETIDSLPDTSTYIAQQGGTNTIKFVGNSGSATDGGAINDLTSAEIAVATAKGWTVTLV